MTTSEQSTVESHASHADSSYQAAGLEQQSHQSTCEIQPSMSREQSAFENSGKQDGRDFDKRCGERGRQPISFRSCEHTDQKAAQMASAPPRQLPDVKTQLMEIRQKVDRTRVRWIRLRREWLSRKAILLASRETT